MWSIAILEQPLGGGHLGRGDVVAKRLASGKLRPRQAYEISYALASAVAGRLRSFIALLTAEMWNLEYRFQAVVKAGHLREPERFLDELVIAAITLPVTAVSSILGMNVIVNDTTQPVELAIAVLAMVVMSAILLIWAKRRGWW